MSTAIRPKLTQDELKQLTALLDMYTEGATASFVEQEIGSADLDREAAYAEDSKELSKALKNTRHDVIASLCKTQQDAHRIRRDVKICRQSHKYLIAACIKTLKGRELLLDYQLSPQDDDTT